MPMPTLPAQGARADGPRVTILDAPAARAALPRLAEILVDCVTHGASVGFMNPFGRDEAEAWWHGVVAEVAAGRVVLFAAEAGGAILGTAQLVPCGKPNQPHRADVAKVLVHGTARRRGVGAALMAALEDEARRRGLLLLTLDTVSGSSGDGLYTHAGWRKVGAIPDYALWPDGGFCDTTVFYKRL